MAKHKYDKIVINTSQFPEPKNKSGLLGEKCNNCGGYGYTAGLKGTSIGCRDCEGTGVKLPTIRDVQKEIVEIKNDLNNLRQAIMNTLGIKRVDSSKITINSHIGTGAQS